jgi:uncharacterized membrane-anchored protein
MTTLSFEDDHDRHTLANELHARPFPVLSAPCYAVSVALWKGRHPDADASKDEQHPLLDLLDRAGAQHPREGANHFSSPFFRNQIKWERHTEFETYTVFVDGLPEQPFAVNEPLFPEDWVEKVRSKVVAACFVHVEPAKGDVREGANVADFADKYFVAESLSVSHVLGGDALVASDFRVDESGLTRFLLLASDGVGERRLGRITQRLIEIETYKSMAMLTLPNAQSVSGSLSKVDSDLADIVAGFAAKRDADSESLDRLMKISADLEQLAAENDSRFSAARAYSTIVEQRIDVLREQRVGGRQTLAEFMTRRFEPAMRTCESTAARLTAMSGRANRAAQLLRTQADVAREEQNQQILSQMDRRAAQQLRLQKTVEGLSVVAVSYYAVNLASYALAPFASVIGLGKVSLTAILTLPVIFLVWAAINRIRKGL